jgi:hypothetical protein
MKSSRILFGSFFVVGGVLLLLAKLDVLHLELGSIWKFWPIVLVLWGISILIGGKTVKVAIAVTAGILLALILFAAVEEWGSFGDDRSTTSQTFVQVFDSSLQRAYLTFQSGGGTFVVKDTCAALFRAETNTNYGNYTLETENAKEERRLFVRLEGDHHLRLGRNTVEMKLNPAPLWDLSFDVGACSLSVDVQDLPVSSVKIHTGVSQVLLTVGERQKECSVTVQAGVSSVKIRVPESVGCELTSEGGLSTRSYPGFHEEGKGLYRTDNFSSAGKRIMVRLHAGVSSLSVRRY